MPKKAAAGPEAFLVEELSDARVRCSQLKAYIKEALELVEKSEQKDQVFEMAGHLLHGIPDVLFKLEKALDSAAMSGALMDYESVKESVRPEKADLLDAMMEDTRIKQLKRHSNEGTTMTPKTAADELISIATEFETSKEIPFARVLDLSAALGVLPKTASEYIEEAEVTPETYRALAASLKANPSKVALAKSIREIIANSREKVMEGFKRANPSMSDADLEKAADAWETHKDNFKSASEEQPTIAELEPQLARFEEGKPADPTSQMSPEDAAKWKTEHAKNKDNFKSAKWKTASAKRDGDEMFKLLDAEWNTVQYDAEKGSGWAQVGNLGRVEFEESGNDPAVIVTVTRPLKFKGHPKDIMESLEKISKAIDIY